MGCFRSTPYRNDSGKSTKKPPLGGRDLTLDTCYARVTGYFMTRQAIIVFAVLLGAGLAGLLWYQLTWAPQQPGEGLALSPTPVMSAKPTVTATPQPTNKPATPEPTPVAVSNTAPTGASGIWIAAFVGATLVGAYGWRRGWQFVSFQL